jgi:hypothetical protein
VRFPTVETVFTTAFKGPFTLVLHKSEGVPAAIALNDATNHSTTLLPSHHLDAAEAERSLQFSDRKAA